MSYCPKCEKTWPDQGVFCPQCGTALIRAADTPAPPAEQAAQPAPARPVRRRPGLNAIPEAPAEAAPPAASPEAPPEPAPLPPKDEKEPGAPVSAEKPDEDDGALWLGGRKPVIPVRRRNTSLKAQRMAAAAAANWDKSRKPWSPLAKKIAAWAGAGVASLLVMILILCLIGGQFSADAVARSYVHAMSRKDYGAMYRLSVLSNYRTVNERDFAVWAAGQVPEFSVYEVTSDRRGSGDSFTEYVSYRYVEDGTGYETSKSLRLVRQPGKRWLFFDSYKVVPEGSVGYCDFVVPVGTEAAVNGSVLRGGERTDGLQYYRSVALFPGEYTVTAVSPVFETQTSSVSVYAGNSGTYTVNPNLKLREEVIKDLSDRQRAFIQKLWDGVKAGIPAERMDFREIPEENRADTMRLYDSLLRSCSDAEGHILLADYTISEIAITGVRGTERNGWFEVSVQASCTVAAQRAVTELPGSGGAEDSGNDGRNTGDAAERDRLSTFVSAYQFTYRLADRDLRLYSVAGSY